MSQKKSEKPCKEKPSVYVKSFFIWTGITLGVLLLLFAAGTGAVYGYMRMYEGKIYPGVMVLDVRLDGMTPDEARARMIEATDAALDKGMSFELEGQSATIQASANADVPDLIRFDLNTAVDEAYLVGRADAMRKIIYEMLKARIRTVTVPVDIAMDRDRIASALELQYQELLPQPLDASFEIEVDDAGEPDVLVIQDVDGAVLDLDGVFEKLEDQAKVLSFQTIYLHRTKVKAAKQAQDLQPLVDQVYEFLRRPGLTFTFEDVEYPIPLKTLASWATADPETNAVTIDQLAFASSIHALAEDIEVESKSGKMEVKDGKIVSFEAGTLGRKVNVEKTLEPVLEFWPPTSTFPLVVEEEHGKITGGDLDELGIHELIGVGQSNFKGSPYNRTQNIKKAVYEHVNGTLIAPDEEFSMLNALGEIDGAHGWLAELVIKGNKTTPEFGGGLCQIGTTMFRGAVNTGLPVTERRNHSYRVSYYEPAGTDATIYDPSPDFKFMNDTGHYVYINAYIEGTEIYFEFWGTNDGREVEVSKPSIYGITAAPPTKLIETTDLAPGQKKCTESAHAGASAHFTTTVIYADGRKREETFRSVYRPWQAVCLIGVEALSGEESNEGSDSTEGSDTSETLDQSQADAEAAPAEEGATVE